MEFIDFDSMNMICLYFMKIAFTICRHREEERRSDLYPSAIDHSLK